MPTGRLLVALLLLLSPALALRATAAPEPKLDGRDCDSFDWIRPEACEAFKAYNADHDNRWWAKWNDRSGYQRVLFRNRGDRVPGIDFRIITQNDVRSDAATRALVDAYARMRLRAFVDEFGFRQDLQDLVFVDFRSMGTMFAPRSATCCNRRSIRRTRSTAPFCRSALTLRTSKTDRSPGARPSWSRTRVSGSPGGWHSSLTSR